jgi:hypothetical protein
MNAENRLSWALCLLRLSVFLVMLMWTLDKFVRPEHATGVFEYFYSLSGVGISAMRVLGALELLLLLGFVAGVARRFTYGAVLLLHAASTFASWRQYAHPFEGVNLLFFAAWPMLAACIALYLLRDADSMTVGGRSRAARTQ